jgi:hypothetical protein
MDFFLIIFGFAGIMGLAGMFFDHKKEQMKLQAKLSEMQEGQVQQELTAIRQRLGVLERIITDKGYHLSDEISSLK